MKTVKVVCLSERDCCSGRPVAQVEILEKVVKIRDRTGKSLSFRKETWAQIKDKVDTKTALPYEVTAFLTLTQGEKNNMLIFIQNEDELDENLIFTSY
jgi:hypothetical protein